MPAPLTPTVFGMTSAKWTSLRSGNLALQDADGWNQPQYYETLHLADINGDGQAELIFRGPFGLFTFAFDRVQGQWQNLNAGDLGLKDTAGWNLPQYYSTLRLADINGDGQAELIFRSSFGLSTWAFDRSRNTWIKLSDGPALDDASGWNQPQYYETLRLADINGDGRAELLVRASWGLRTFAFDPSRNTWYDLNAGDLGLTDTANWNLPQYYRTLRLADIDGDGRAELVMRGASGVHTFAFDPSLNKWFKLSDGPALDDASGWNQPQYYETLRLADIGGDGRAELIFRSSSGLSTWAFDSVLYQWVDLNAGDLGLKDTAGWNLPQYYRTLRLADIDGDGRAELLIRGTSGMLTFAFDPSPSRNKWMSLDAGLLGLADVHYWNSPEYYSTIHAADIDGDGQSELLARSPSGIISWHYNLPSSDLPVLFHASSNFAFESAGYEVSYRFDPDPSLPKGTFAVQEVAQVPASDSNVFTCTLVNSQGQRVGDSLEATATTAGVSKPFPLTALPGRFAIAYLNRHNRNLPNLVIPIRVPEELATRVNQCRMTFIWSVVPKTWPTTSTVLNNQASLECNGSSVYADIGNPDNLQITKQITLQAWIKPTASDGLRNIIAHGYSLNPQGEVYLRLANGQYQVGSWNGTDHVATYPIPLSDLGRWVYLCGTYDGTQWTLYRNGQPVAVRKDTIGAVQVQASWAIGARGGGGERFFRGRLRGIALWKTARTAQEIENDMLSSPVQSEQDAAVYWPLDDGPTSSNGAGATGQDLQVATVMGAKTSPWFEPQSLNPLIELPKTPLTVFTQSQKGADDPSSQKGAYDIIGGHIDSSGPINIRTAYINKNYYSLFSNWQGLLQNDNPPSWPSSDVQQYWTSDNWKFVRSTLAAELDNVQKIWGLHDHTKDLLGELLTRQGQMLQDVAQKLHDALTSPPAPPVDPTTATQEQAGYWVFTILSFALGIASVAPEAKGAQMALLLGSDVAGLLASSSNSNNQSSTPLTLDSNLPRQIQNELNAAYQALLNLNGDRTNRILQDELLLPIVGRLAGTVWNWPPNDFGELPTLVEHQYRRSFYQRLIPNQYVVSEWMNHFSARATVYPDAPNLVLTPDYACWSIRSSQNRQQKWQGPNPPDFKPCYNLYIVHTPGDPYGGTDWHGFPGGAVGTTGDVSKYYPSQEILTELFSALGVSMEDFFTCTNGWENTPFTAQEVQYNSYAYTGGIPGI